MFAKKFLSIVALIFTGSQISSISAAFTPCSQQVKDFEPTTNGSCTPISSYCIDDDNLIYAVDGSPTCKCALNGVFAFNENTGEIIDLESVNIASPQDIKANVVLYNCNGTTCAKTSGIVKDTTDNYVVAVAGGASSASNHEDSSCSAIGKINTASSDVLCITTALTASKPDTRYIMENVAANAFGTGSSNNDKSIIIKTATNIFAYDNLLTGTDYCVSSTTNEITERPKNYCDTTVACDEYYTCTEGVCEDKTTDYAVRRGVCNPLTKENCISDDYGDYYYIGNESGKDASTLNGFLSISAGETGYLYKCTVSASDTVCTEISDSAGYFLNIDGLSDIKYIQCTVATRTTTNCIGLVDAPSTVDANCSAGSGHIILDGANYETCTDTVDSNATPLVAKSATIQTSCTSNGELIKDGVVYKICVKQSDNSLEAIAFPSGATTVSYFVDSGNTSAFNADELANHFVVVDISAKKAVVDQSNTPKKYRYAITDTRQIIEKENAGSNSMCDLGSLNTAVGHEFAMTKSYPDTDKVNYYKVNSA